MTVAQERLLGLLGFSARSEIESGSSPAWTAEEWAAVAAEASKHRVIPLLHHRIGLGPAPSGIPAGLGARLRQEHRRNAAINLRRFYALAPVLEGLSRAGVPVIVLKGAYLATAVYSSIALRVMGDIDILVAREHLEQADAILTEKGFQRREFGSTPPAELNEFHYLEPSSHTLLEVHWELLPPDYPFQLDRRGMMADAVPATIAGTEVRVFAPEDQLIHLGAHATIHRFEFGLRPLCDIATFIARVSPDWARLVERAEKMGVARSVGVPLLLARDLLQAAVPDAAIAGLLPRGMPEALAQEARETVLLNWRGQRNGGPNPNLVLFFGRKGWRDRFALLRSRFFPSRQMVAALFPVAADSLRIWWYYPQYGWRILARNVAGLKSMLAGKARRTSRPGQAAALMDWMLK